MRHKRGISPLLFLLSMALGFRFVDVQAMTFGDLPPIQRERVAQGHLVSVPITFQRNSLNGTFFQFLPRVNPKEVANLFLKFEHRANYLPGITSVRLVRFLHPQKALLRYHLNPSVFITPELQKVLPRQIYDLGTFNYDREEEFEEIDGIYSFHWKMNQESQRFGADEEGNFEFRPFLNGTLICFTNRIAPFYFEKIFSGSGIDVAANWIRKRLVMMAHAQNRRTMKAFIEEVLVQKRNAGFPEEPDLEMLDMESLEDESNYQA